MPKPKLPSVRMVSCGVIVYTKQDGTVKILLLEQNNKRYEDRGRKLKKKVIDIGPSGQVEGDENMFQTATRELLQETNLSLKIDPGYTDSYSYVFEGIAYNGKFKDKKARIIKTRKYFLASASEEQLRNLKLSDEHVSYKFATLEEALSSKYIMKPQKELLRRLQARFASVN
jgi:8-oxo-dGTP pyrophosphatase MutT (NUDIX family)